MMADARQAKADALAQKRKDELVRQAGLEYLGQTIGGKKLKPISDAETHARPERARQVQRD